tara:strand:- start:4095 stop:4676 length:582 start_codon:yes stop_codon:yes gene_type:complete
LLALDARVEDCENVPTTVPLVVEEEVIELLPPITFMPTLRVEPEEDIEETPPISIWPTAETTDGPECKETALSVNDGATDKLPEADKLLNAATSATELALTDAVLARVELPNLLMNAPAVKAAELLKEETPALVTIAEEETEQLPDREDTQEPSKKASEETEAELLVEETPPISTKPVEGAEPVLVTKLAAAI